MKGKEKMNVTFNKINFYSMMLRDRFPLARIIFPTERGEGKIEFFRTPLGTALRVELEGDDAIRDVKMYDRKRSEFAIQNVFCGDNLVRISEGVFVGVSNKLSIEDAIGRDFLIKLDNISVIARAEFLHVHRNTVDKTPNLVYN